MNTKVNGILIIGTQGVQGASGASGVQGLNGRNGIQGVSNILPFSTGKNISSAFLSSISASIPTNTNTITATPFLPAFDSAYSSLSIFVTVNVAGGLIKILIYDDLNGVPNNLLFQSTDLDCSTTGKKTVNTTGTFLSGKTYWLCIWSSVNGIFLRASSANSISSIRLSTTTPLSFFRRNFTFSTQGTAPNPYGTTSPVTGNSQLIVITLI